MSSTPTVLFFAWPQYDPAELAFWEDLRDGLATRGYHLVLASTTPPPTDTAIDHVMFAPTIDALWPPHCPRLDVTLLGLDPEALLSREEDWSGPTLVPAVRGFRRAALNAIASHAADLLAQLTPSVVVIWNGHHVPEMILDVLARGGGAPVLYVERAPIPRALFADECGLSASSAIARHQNWPVPAESWLRCADDVSSRLAAGNLTWWDQPNPRGAEAIRRELGIADGQQVIVFAGQVDEDTQQFLYSPHFPDNLTAWRWVLNTLSRHEDVYVLGKHHPKANTPPEAYVRVLAESGVQGAWRADVGIDDALAIADRVVAVNSTVVYEALARRIPTLVLGQWLLGGRDVAWEIDGPGDRSRAVDAWLGATDMEVRHERWRASLGYLLSRCIYAYERDAVACGALGADDLAARIADHAPAGAAWHSTPALQRTLFTAAGRPVPWRSLADAPSSDGDATDVVQEWNSAHTLRDCLLEARRAAQGGRRVVIWGTGEGGRLMRQWLTVAGVAPAAFVSSRPTNPTFEGRPVLEPQELCVVNPRDFVLVASTALDAILPQLVSLGFATGSDVLTADCDTLARLMLAENLTVS